MGRVVMILVRLFHQAMPRLMKQLEDFIQLNFHPRRTVKVTVRFFLYLAP